MRSEKLAVGILAHVDAGKTTLAEGILYLTGSIRKLGRVDHQNAFLDTFELERERGITIFSKQAEFKLGSKEVTLLDTPGHVDFSAEMERTLQILDYAVLVISGPDGVQGHVQTLWRLLNRYEIPVFLFINKMDQPGTHAETILQELKERLDERCLDFGKKDDAFYEELAVSDETVLEQYLEEGTVEEEEIHRLIRERKIFPCYFGSALKTQGVEEFLQGLEEYTDMPEYPENFGARVYKISRDAQGNRLTHMKITGGSLKVKMPVSAGEDKEEKADQIRIYSGSGFRTVTEAEAGTVCAVTGLASTFCGQGLGEETEAALPVLEPVLTYEIQLPPECDVYQMFLKLRSLEEEEPELHIVWKEQFNEIHAQVMGEVQIEILKRMIRERYGVEVDFGAGSIVYKETIAEPVEGVGHFEPLRHYAEVHLLMEPGEPGSGLQFETACSEDVLDKNWQRLILTHLEERAHKGVLTGSEITDMKITVVAGRAHPKHTEGGDFRQATYRAVRQGLRSTRCVLLEPVYEFSLEIPSDKTGRALADIQRMQGSFQDPEINGDMTILRGTAPAAAMRDYQTEVIAYTRGCGRLSCALKGYEPCPDAERIIEETAYDPDLDLDNPCGSVFCSHGAGFLVDWDQVRDYMHVDSGLRLQEEEKEEEEIHYVPPATAYRGMTIDEEELEEIFTRTYGAPKKERNQFNRKKTVRAAAVETYKPKVIKQEPEYLLVDGYNIIFAWEELNELAKYSVEAARNKLMDILSNYQGYKKVNLILVYDAYKVEGNVGSVMKYHNIHVVYTKEAETADQYIEKTAHELGRKYTVTVATSDHLEQIIIMGQGAHRMSAEDLKEEIKAVNIEIRNTYLQPKAEGKNYLFDHMSEDLQSLMEDVRMGRKNL